MSGSKQAKRRYVYRCYNLIMEQDTFRSLLLNECRLDLKKPVLVGVSGGPDSLCLLNLLIESGMTVVVAHLNHKLRPEADDEAIRVKAFCSTAGVACVIEERDVTAHAKTNKLSIEESARTLRYQFLFEQARLHKVQAVLVAHNADDQIETVLMHLLRGSGPGGLKGILMRSMQPQWSETIPLVRPLLKTSRQEILEYCQDHQLSPVYDQSNLDSKYFRNRIRQELLPELETYNPRIRELLLRTAEVIGCEDEYINDQVEKAWQQSVIRQGERFVVFSKPILTGFHPALIKRMLRQAIQLVDPGLRDIDFKALQRAFDFLERNHHANHLSLLSEVEMIKNRHDQIIVCRKSDPLVDLWPRIEPGGRIPLNLQGINELGNGWQIKCEIVDHPREIATDELTGTVDAEKIGEMIMDICKTGDVFSPFGLAGKTCKLGDFWTNKGLAERARSTWPLVRNENQEIVWVAGFQISEKYRVTEQTAKCLVMRLQHVN